MTIDGRILTHIIMFNWNRLFPVGEVINLLFSKYKFHETFIFNMIVFITDISLVSSDAGIRTIHDTVENCYRPFSS